MTYREKLATVVDLEADRLLLAARGDALSEAQVERLECLCRCSKTLGGEDAEGGDEPEEEEDETKLLSIAER